MSTMRTLLGALTTLLIVLLAVSACTSEEKDAQSQAPEGSRTIGDLDVGDVTLNVGIFQDVRRAQVNLTEFFNNTPYKVKWSRLNGAGPTVQALYGDAIDISWGLSDTATPKGSAEARQPWTAASAPIKIVGLLKPAYPDKYPSSIIAANAHAGINTLADLRGKTYSYNEGGNANAVALLALNKAGLTRSDVRVQLLQSDSIGPAIINGSVQAGSTSISQVGAAIEAGQVKQIATGAQVGFPGYVSITARTKALKDPKLSAAIGDFSERIARFERWAAQHPEEAGKPYVTTQQLTEAQGLLAARSTAAYLVPVNDDGPDVAVEAALERKLVEVGFLPRSIDIRALFDDRYTAQIERGNQP